MDNLKWYNLDGAGIIYAALTNKKTPYVFRYSAILKNKVDKVCLQKALNESLTIYPNYNVTLKKGFFWYYLQENDKKIKVIDDYLPVCHNLVMDETSKLFRISINKNKINFEVSHILTDGRGGIEFFKLLLLTYINLKHKLKINVITNSSNLEKTENAFHKYYKKGDTKKEKKLKIYKYKAKKMRRQTLYMECNIKLKKLLDLAHLKNVTITEYLTGALIYSFKDELNLKDLNKYISIKIPIDFRSHFKSNSSKNFFGLTHITYKFKNKDESFDKVLGSIKKQFKEMKINKILNKASSFIAYEQNLFINLIPLNIKTLALRFIYKLFSDKSTTSLSNVGEIKIDEKAGKYIDRITALSSTNGFLFTICSFKDNLSIGISTKYKYNDVIKNFCTFLKDQGLDLEISVSEVK